MKRIPVLPCDITVHYQARARATAHRMHRLRSGLLARLIWGEGHTHRPRSLHKINWRLPTASDSARQRRRTWGAPKRMLIARGTFRSIQDVHFDFYVTRRASVFNMLKHYGLRALSDLSQVTQGQSQGGKRCCPRHWASLPFIHVQTDKDTQEKGQINYNSAVSISLVPCTSSDYFEILVSLK